MKSSFSENCKKILRETPVLEYSFSKVVCLTSKFNKIVIHCGRFPVKFLEIFRTTMRCSAKKLFQTFWENHRDQTMSKPLFRDHTYMTSTRKEGGGFSKFVTCLRILLFLNSRSNVYSCGWWGWGWVKKLVIFLWTS